MVGIKKPEKAIFDLTLEKLGVKPEEAVFLDDLGGNLKTARLMGMSTIKVSQKWRITLAHGCKHWLVADSPMHFMKD